MVNTQKVLYKRQYAFQLVPRMLKSGDETGLTGFQKLQLCFRGLCLDVIFSEATG